MPSDRWHPPYTDEEAEEARLFSNRFGPANAWTATNGTAARMIGRLLRERARLLAEVAGLRRDVDHQRLRAEVAETRGQSASA